MIGRLDFDADSAADDPEFGDAEQAGAPAEDHRTGPPAPTPTRPTDATHRFAALRETLRQAAERRGGR